jgi:hypothetical protein
MIWQSFIKSYFCLILLGLLIPSEFNAEEKTAKSAPTSQYKVYREFQLYSQTHGLDGYLQLLQDRRLFGTHRKNLWGSDNFFWCYKPESYVMKEFCASVQKEPLLSAIVRIVDSSGKVIDSRMMERPLASVTTHKLYDSEMITYFITIDYSTGAGSYNGPIEILVEVNNGKLKWVKGVKDSGEEKEITLMRSLKTAWRLIPRNDGRGQDIVKIACRPNLGKPFGEESSKEDFIVIYTRFNYDYGQKIWLQFERKEFGYWEDEGQFPNRNRFP